MRQAAGSGIVQRFLAFLRVQELVGQTVGIGFSGGPDSTALAFAASEAAQARVIRPVALHVDHGVRPESHTDLPILRQTCDRLGLELRTVRASLPPDASEDEMRVERYRLLARAMAELGGNAVMTAHHAGDQAETVLLHIIRGSGLEGAAGMAPVEQWSNLDKPGGLTVIRPFLLESRSALLALVETYELPYLTDPTNADRDKSRNVVRLDVLPTLEEVHAGAGASIARFAGIARADHEALQEIARESMSRHVRGKDLQVASVRAEPVAIQRRVIRNWVRELAGIELSWNRTEAIREAIHVNRGGTMIELGEHWVARRAGKVVRLSQSGEGKEG